jgi:hypothetical protein
MSKNSGYIVKTKNGLVGRTYHIEKTVNNKTVVHVEKEGKFIKMLCDPNSLIIVGFAD